MACWGGFSSRCEAFVGLFIGLVSWQGCCCQLTGLSKQVSKAEQAMCSTCYTQTKLCQFYKTRVSEETHVLIVL